MKKSTLKEILGTSIYLLGVVLAAFLVIKFVGQRTVVIGSSMNTTLYDEDNLILNKISYAFHDPERFDVVVFPFRDDTGRNYIKRVIGLPGETVRIDEEGNIFIDDELLSENYGIEIIRNGGRAAGDGFTLGDDEYFVMGDNRNASDDSRFSVGAVKRGEIIGKAWVRIYPFNSVGKIK